MFISFCSVSTKLNSILFLLCTGIRLYFFKFINFTVFVITIQSAVCFIKFEPQLMSNNSALSYCLSNTLECK